jgi:myo-inositol 2-dehydrogenase/D-chiro-inositol 1-dehydrogenase
VPAPVALGLAGLGIHGARYARHLLAGDVPGARLRAVSRADAARGTAFAREHGLDFEADPTALADRDDVDAVVVALRPDLHPRVAATCLARGKPVLVEKPVATTLADADALVAADPDGRWFMAAHTLRFDAVVERLHALAPGLGRLDLIGIDQHFEPASRPWLDHPGPGGVLLNTAVHGFDLLRHMTGSEPESVDAVGACRTTRRTPDVVSVGVVLGPDGPIGSVRNARSTAGRAGRIELVGEHGHLVGDFIHRSLVRIAGRSITDLGPVPDRPTIPTMLAAFVAAVREGRPMPVTARDGAIAVRTALAAQESVDTGVRRPVGRPGACNSNETSP